MSEPVVTYCTRKQLVVEGKVSKALQRRYRKTIRFMAGSFPPPARVLDLGTPNLLGEVMRVHGYDVTNTPKGVDLDECPEIVGVSDVDAVTAFEILEHLVNPLGVLRAIEAPRLFATVPLRLWFATAYRNPRNQWDCHFHEFEDWQFDWLLEKAYWRVVRRERWIGPTGRVGVRPLLRLMTPRFYAVEAVRV